MDELTLDEVKRLEQLVLKQLARETAKQRYGRLSSHHPLRRISDKLSVDIKRRTPVGAR